jgi:hypothetical protein
MKDRKRATFEPVTLGHIRGHGVRNLLLYCNSITCNHRTKMNADHLPALIVLHQPGRIGTAPERRLLDLIDCL